MVKVSLHLPYSHLLPTPHPVVVHKIFLPSSFNSHHFPRCQSGHIVRLAVGILFLPLPSSILDLIIPLTLVHPFSIRRCCPLSSFFIHDVLSSSRIPLSPCYAFSSPPSYLLYSSQISPFLYHPTFPFLPSWPAWAYCPARRSYFSLPPFSLFPSRSRSIFSIYFLPPLSSASPLLRPYCLSRCLPKVAWPNVAAPFVAITQSGCLPPCQTPLAWCRL